MSALFYKLDENKNAIPCSSKEWGDQREIMRRTKTKHVNDEMVDGKRVSTVWLGLNHAIDEKATPLIFETLVFEGKDEIYCERYSIWEEAEEGHKRAVEWVKNGCKEDE
jgi:hypothetical protein